MRICTIRLNISILHVFELWHGNIKNKSSFKLHSKKKCFKYYFFKFRSLFGKQLENGMKITWRDEDGDDVSIESDEELLIALHEMKGKVWFKMVQNGPKWSKNGLDQIGSVQNNLDRPKSLNSFSHKKYSLLYF